jgi:hypothetical protein
MINENDPARNAIMGMFGVGPDADKPTPEETKSVKSAPPEVTEHLSEPQAHSQEEKAVVHETSVTKVDTMDLLGQVLERQVNQKQVAQPGKTTTPECRKAVAEQLGGKKGQATLQGLLERLL